MANTDFSMILLDLNLNTQIASFNKDQSHSDKVNDLVYLNDNQNEQLQHVLISASQDGTVKLWDRRNCESVGQLVYQERKPFFSVATNKLVITAGSNQDIVFWDVRKLKSPMFNYRSSHTDDVTSLTYHQTKPNWLVSCSTDNLMCHFNFEGKQSFNEDETMEGVYCSNQPLIDCGFISDQHMWTLTSINTLEIIDIENCGVFCKIEKVSTVA